MPRRVFVDMDGVLADFDTRYRALFGEPPDRTQPTPDWFWPTVREAGAFFEDLDPLPDAQQLWDGLAKYDPTVLSGIPTVEEMADAAAQKRRWLQRHFGDVPHIFCRSKDKCLHGQPGDILIDDWTKYRNRWVKMGGIFVVHTSAEQSLREVHALMAVDIPA